MGPLSLVLISKAVIEALSAVLEIVTQTTEKMEKCSHFQRTTQLCCYPMR